MLAGHGGDKQVVDAAHGDDLHRLRLAFLPRDIDQPLHVRDRYLPIEIRVDEQDRLPDVLDDLGRVERQQALRPGRIDLPAHLRRHAFPSLAAQDSSLDFPLQVDLLLALGGRRLQAIERVLLLLERELGTRRGRRVDRDHAADSLRRVRPSAAPPMPLAVTDHGDPLRIDVSPIGQPLDDGSHVVGQIA